MKINMTTIKEFFKNWKSNKQHYYVVYCLREANSYEFMEFIPIKPNQKTIKYDEDNTFTIDIQNHTYRFGNNKYYCIDINSRQIHFEQLEENEFVSSKVNTMALEDAIIEQLARATTQPIQKKYDYIALLIGLVIGSLIGFIIKIFIPFP